MAGVFFSVLHHRLSVQEPLAIVSATITPGVLILAAGSLISSTLTRLARVVDRTRLLLAEVERLVEDGQLKKAALHARWLTAYSRRTVIIERTLQLFYIAIAIFVASTLAIAGSDLLGAFPWLPAILVITGILALFLGAAALIWETSLSTGSLRQEIAASNLSLLDPSATAPSTTIIRGA